MVEHQKKLLQTLWQIKRMKPSDVLHGITFFEFSVLSVVKHGKDNTGGLMKVSEVAQMLEAVPPAVSRAMKVLEEDGMITRGINKKDRRNICVEITPKGERILIESERILQDVMEHVFQRMGEEKVELFLDTMQEFGKALSAEMDLRKNKTNREQ